MSNGSDKLIYIYSVDTSSFYNEKETEIDRKLIISKQYKSNLNDLTKPLNKFKNGLNKLMTDEEVNREEIIKLEDELIKYYKKNMMFKEQIDDYLFFDEQTRQYKVNQKSTLCKLEVILNRDIRYFKTQLDKEASLHNGKRTLRKESLKDLNKISLFESYLTRSLGIPENELSTEIIVVRAYRYIIFEDIIKNGFRYDGQDFEYFASSAGQIRNKKSLFLRTNSLNKNNHQIRNKLMCGLSTQKINRKGGINQNKFQAYLSLANSASKPWDGFSIDKCIVVDDMELEVKGLVDYIDHETYKIKRIEKSIPINFMDGAGLILPSVTKKSLQFRMPFFKGLLIPYNYLNFILEYPNADFLVKDIYGTYHNIAKEGIQIIFTKSQFKLHGYYKNWEEYKSYFKKFNCEAAICKIEEDSFEDKPINYQMIQSLNFSDGELRTLSQGTVDDILKIGEDKDTMLRLLGADDGNSKKNHFQQSLSLYPQLLNDEHSKQSVKDRKKSLVKEAKSGKILLEGTKRSYISPDLYAFSEWLFAKVEKPNGLLKNGEVSCKLFDDEKLDVLRSPHLFREHCVRKNVLNEETDKWFITNCIYTSVHDMISKQLMFDVDGDDALIVKNKLFVDRAERQMIHTVPLDYTLATAKKSKITSSNIVNSLKAAYSKNIGEISNLITKIWNSSNHLKKEEMDLIKVLCMENNAIIDYAKTLWMPERTDSIQKKIRKYTNMKVPYFFQFAKDKEKSSVEQINESTMNRLGEVIPNKRISFTSVAGKFDHKNLMRNKRQKIEDDLSRNVIDTYIELDRRKSVEVKNQIKESDNTTIATELKVYKQIRKEILNVINDPLEVTDILVKFLYGEKKSKFKDTLWRCFGDEIVRNIKKNQYDLINCIECGTEIENPTQRQVRCDSCQRTHTKEMTRLRVEKHRKCNAEFQ